MTLLLCICLLFVFREGGGKGADLPEQLEKKSPQPQSPWWPPAWGLQQDVTRALGLRGPWFG